MTSGSLGARRTRRLPRRRDQRERALDAPQRGEGSNRVHGDPRRRREPRRREGATDDEDEPDEAELPDLDPDVEGEEGGRDLAGREPDLGERAREAEPVEQPEHARHQPGRASHERGPRARLTRQLDRQEEDARRDADLDRPRRDAGEAERRERQRDAVADRERGDRAEKKPRSPDQQQEEPEDEEQVIGTGQDVLDAEFRIAADYVDPPGALRDPEPGLASAHDALDDPAVRERDPDE